MKVPKPLTPELFAWSIGILILMFIVVMAFAYLGWFGVFIIGLLGMSQTVLIDLNDVHPTTGLNPAALREKIRIIGDNAKEEIVDRIIKQKIFFILNTIWMVMIVLGFLLFITYQI